MPQKEDLRVRKTKKALSDAFFELLSTKPFEDITINELCDKADVRRATFYKHYTDKFNFLTSYTKSLRNRFDTIVWKSDKPDTTAKYYAAYAKRAVGFISENEQIVQNLIKSNLLPTCLNIIIEQNYIDTKERLEKSVAAGMKLCASPSSIARMCTGGVSSIILDWIMSDKKRDADEVADEIGILVSTLIGSSQI